MDSIKREFHDAMKRFEKTNDDYIRHQEKLIQDKRNYSMGFDGIPTKKQNKYEHVKSRVMGGGTERGVIEKKSKLNLDVLGSVDRDKLAT